MLLSYTVSKEVNVIVSHKINFFKPAPTCQLVHFLVHFTFLALNNIQKVIIE